MPKERRGRLTVKRRESFLGLPPDGSDSDNGNDTGDTSAVKLSSGQRRRFLKKDKVQRRKNIENYLNELRKEEMEKKSIVQSAGTALGDFDELEMALDDVKVQSKGSKKMEIMSRLGRRKMNENQFHKDFERGWESYIRNISSIDFQRDPFDFAIDAIESSIEQKKNLLQQLESVE